MRFDPYKFAWATLIVSLAVGLGLVLVWWFGLLSTSLQPSSQILFHPDQMTEIRWHSAGKEILLQRSGPAAPWSSDQAVDSRQVQSFLLALAQAGSGTPTRVLSAKTRVVLRSASGEEWSGVFNGHVFAWQTGRVSGKGGRPFESLKEVFERGQFAFSNPRWDWCQARPVRLSWFSDGTQVELRAHEGGWLMARDRQEPRSIDTTSVEEWLGRSCSIEGTAWMDHQVAGRPATDGEFSVEFSDGTTKTWPYSAKTGIIQVDAQHSLRGARHFVEGASHFSGKQ